MSRGFHVFSVVTAAATLGLIAIGGSVTSRGVGLAVPDWPTTYGHNLFLFPFSQWIGGVFYEHVHRLAAAGVGLLTLVLAACAYGRSARRWLRYSVLGLALLLAIAQPALNLKPETFVIFAFAGTAVLLASLVWPVNAPAPPPARWLAIAAVGLVLLQGLIGGLRVTLFKDEVGIAHAALAQLFFLCLVAIAVVSSSWWRSMRSAATVSTTTRRLVWITVAALFFQLVIGAAMRHQHAGLAVPDFPLAYGRAWPPLHDDAIARINQTRIDVRDYNPVTRGHIILHMSHRLWALVIVVLIGYIAVRLKREAGGGHSLSRFSQAWFAAALLQGILGAAVVWSNKSADVATAHVVGGAVVLACGWVLGLCAIRIIVTQEADGSSAPVPPRFLRPLELPSMKS